jgi:uncharacterized flavoprotein (TIGR03862 family)
MTETNTTPVSTQTVAVIGGGPAGLMAAQTLMDAGLSVDLFDTMPSVGRKFLLAGKGGLNLTHSEPLAVFETRFGAAQAALTPLLRDFGPDQVKAWALKLGVDTFVGTSGRVFPTDMKAAPLLRAWLHQLRHPTTGEGVRLHMRHRWTGWAEDGSLRFTSPQGEQLHRPAAVVLALGGGSWARLGSDGAWVPLLQARGVAVAPLQPANCGFESAWSEFFSSRFAGQPFKSVAIRFTDSLGQSFSRKGEFVATASGVEGSLVYAVSHLLRDEITRHGSATFHLDLLPDKSSDRVLAEVTHPRGSRSLSSHLKSRLNLDGIKSAILHEVLSKADMADLPKVAATLKALPLRVTATRPLDEAISTAGGVPFAAMDGAGMLSSVPSVFCAGEMLDWEAPTGGYLMTASLASGRAAGLGVVGYLGK